LAEFPYLLILRRRGTARLLLPTLIGRIPDSIAATAIVVLVRSVTGPYSVAGLAAGAPAAPSRQDAAASSAGPLRSGRFRVLLVADACYGVAAGILNLAFAAFAAAHGGVAWAGVLVAVWGAGSLAGGLAYGSRNWRFPAERRAMVCLALFSAVLMLLAAAPGLPSLAVLMIPLCIPLSPWLGSLSASVQRAVPAAGTTEAFAWTFAVITVGMAAGNACGGVITQAANARAAFLAAGGLGLAGAGAGALWLHAQWSRRASTSSALPILDRPRIPISLARLTRSCLLQSL